MHPDVYSREYQLMQHDMRLERERRDSRQAALHRAAVARRRKAKRGGKR